MRIEPQVANPDRSAPHASLKSCAIVCHAGCVVDRHVKTDSFPCAQSQLHQHGAMCHWDFQTALLFCSHFTLRVAACALGVRAQLFLRARACVHTTLQQVNFVVCQLAAYPLGILFRMLPTSMPWLRHLVGIVWGE
jgi:hypothetical protein